ncbi:hypothetical protein FQR65_LT01131 [Abscondita terminalis]|nr:hypothetical protein FQR65_LT01131 [Abscondita terminalis]
MNFAALLFFVCVYLECSGLPAVQPNNGYESSGLSNLPSPNVQSFEEQIKYNVTTETPLNTSSLPDCQFDERSVNPTGNQNVKAVYKESANCTSSTTSETFPPLGISSAAINSLSGSGLGK